MEDAKELPDPSTLLTDVSSCADGSGAGLILTNPKGMDGANGCRKPPENVDSRLVANQVNGTYVAKETDMIRYLEKENKKAVALSKIASTSFAHLSKQVLVEELKEKSISAAEVLAVVEEEGDT
ncbi:hypothetical protein Tco_0431585 [Tanacetum coccineum]